MDQLKLQMDIPDDLNHAHASSHPQGSESFPDFCFAVEVRSFVSGRF